MIVVNKKDKPDRWFYNLGDTGKLNPGETADYHKGLGSWDEDDLKHVVKTDGLQKMINILEFDDDSIIEEWLGDNSEPRKKYILANDFSIAEV